MEALIELIKFLIIFTIGTAIICNLTNIDIFDKLSEILDDGFDDCSSW